MWILEGLELPSFGGFRGVRAWLGGFGFPVVGLESRV